MTGGTALILGDIGRNFAAGMSGGVAYVYGRHNIGNVNLELVSILDLDDKDINVVKDILNKHILHTESKIVKQILDNFDPSDFFKVLPNDYARIMTYIDEAKANNSLDPLMDAFNKAMEVR